MIFCKPMHDSMHDAFSKIGIYLYKMAARERSIMKMN